MREVTASAPGKVNLLLRVGDPTDDGYHPLVTVFESLNMRETVRVRTSRTPGIHVNTVAYLPSGEVDEQTTALMAEVPTEQHLAYRAARTLQKLAALGPWASTCAGISITVDKHVPVAGGMAGGSADAAATLVACNALWELGLSNEQLHAIGRTLGADVPACLEGGIALGTGRGDHMTQLLTQDDAPSHTWVLALAHRGLSTPEVFRTLDEAGGVAGRWAPLPTEDDLRTVSGACGALPPVRALVGECDELVYCLANDLEEAALRLYPELDGTFAAARAAGALAVILSGSGPTVAALVRDEEHAAQVAAALEEAPEVARTVIVTGPARGAYVHCEEGK